MENTFKDARGRDWTVVIDGYVLYRARTNGKVDLSLLTTQAMDGGAIDPAILVELAFYGCEHQARIQAGKVDKEDFLRGLRGKAMVPALEATAAGVMECFGVDMTQAEEDEEGQEGKPPFPGEEPEAPANGA